MSNRVLLVAIMMLLWLRLSPAAELHDLRLSVEGVDLHATLVEPSTAVTLVILHTGSGPTDRNGNQPGMVNNSLLLLSDALAAANFAVLRYDKRGVGESQSSQAESDLRPSHYIEDLAAWVEWARSTDRFRAVVLLGHSEGAMFAKAATALARVDAVISLAGSGRPMAALLLEQTEGRRPGDIDRQFRHILAELEAGRMVDNVPPLLAALFRPSVQSYLIDWLAIDPAQLADQIDVPLLVVSGSTDLQVARADFDALASHASQSVWIEGMNHVLKKQSGPLGEQMASYLNPDMPLHEKLAPVLLDFLREVEKDRW
ncbi:MAG: alpha/beta fold hydrolase [Wenzhouxiangella sp.]|nr:alpha/beta fold hydrolase [Wenzhouxiangella sp.]MCH8478777.1 alpha/beta hydrolase [Wenzhouxiangella sp.]TVR98017.1 MAG: alpha/beta fold hydrolase [Wenzhouxiangellaceae bacterium]